jgi:DNA primase
LRVRVLKLEGGLDPDDYVRKHGGEVYTRLLAGAPYFWEYLMDEAGRLTDLDQPAMKAAAVADVMQHVSRILDRVEQMEVARAVAAGLKVPENLIFERIKVTPPRPSVPPVARTLVPPRADRRLTVAEKQLIQALLQGVDMAGVLEPFLQTDFASRVWSRPVLDQLVKDPARNVETALGSVQDEELKKEVRSAVLEPFGPISTDQAMHSVKQLYDSHLVQKLDEIRQQLKEYGSGPAPAELVRRHMEIIAERNRVAAFKS